MRVIDFGSDVEKAKSRFTIVVTAAFNGRAPDGAEGTRLLGKVQDAIEAASVESGPTRELRDGVTEIILEDAQYEIMKSRFFGAGIDWTAAASRRVTDAHDTWLAAREVPAAELAGARSDP